jgi:hypothetical protein
LSLSLSFSSLSLLSLSLSECVRKTVHFVSVRVCVGVQVRVCCDVNIFHNVLHVSIFMRVCK